MDNVTFVLAIFTALTSLIAAVASLVGALQKKKINALSLDLEKAKQKELSSKNELYKVYLNLKELLDIEKELAEELSIGKPTTRKGRLTDRYAQPKHVEKRITDLETELRLRNDKGGSRKS